MYFYTEPLPQRSLCTEQFLHADFLAPKKIDTEKIVHRIAPKKIHAEFLHAETLSRTVFTQQKLFRTEAFTDRFFKMHSNYYRQMVFTQKVLRTEVLRTEGFTHNIFPQQRKLMGSSAQNSSGVHWCRRWVRFRRRSRRFQRRSGRLWCGLGGFGAKPGQVQRGSEEGSNEGFGEGLRGFGAEPGQVQQGSGEGSGQGLEGFGAEPGQVQEGSGEGLGGFGTLLQSQVRFNRVPEKVPEKVWEALVQSQVRFNRVRLNRFRRR